MFRNTYRVPSARLSGRNYALPGLYFVTICTKNRIPWFGDIHDQTMHLSDVGRIAHTYWNDIPTHFPFIRLDRFVIMPDHVHGIIVIGETSKTNTVRIYKPDPVETPYGASLQRQTWQPSCLGVIVNQFKSAVTRSCRKNGNNDFAWQPRFHDHIIHSNHERNRIAQYIMNNPAQWKPETDFE